MLWIEVIRQLSAQLAEPFELEFVVRGLGQSGRFKGIQTNKDRLTMDKLTWLNLMREPIGDEDIESLTEIVQQLKKQVPPQYIVGWAEFCDLQFKVDERVLIPRQETEELVRLISENKDSITSEMTNKPVRVLDIGTGSGAIAISLAKKHPDWQVSASDLSLDALELARENAKLNDVNIDFIQSDVFDKIEGRFDLIVSNPPYIDWADQNEVDDSVRAYEPDSALYADHKGYAIYEKIAQEGRDYLTQNGQIYLEIGYKQGENVKALLEANFPEKEVRIHQDFFGKDRMINVR